MHGFVIVLLPEDAMRQDKINLFMEIEERVYPYKSFYHKGDDRPCRCTEHWASPEPSCRDCQGTGRTCQNPKGKMDYWLLGGRFDGYIAPEKPIHRNRLAISSWNSSMAKPLLMGCCFMRTSTMTWIPTWCPPHKSI